MAFENATPRPWAVRFDHDFENLEIVAPDDGKPGRRVVCEGDDTERTQHDFELIVTAVNAHDGLVESVTNLLSLVRAHTGPDDAIANAAIEQAEAVLNLARGEQS